jgi:hypothetical protein
LQPNCYGQHNASGGSGAVLGDKMKLLSLLLLTVTASAQIALNTFDPQAILWPVTGPAVIGLSVVPASSTSSVLVNRIAVPTTKVPGVNALIATIPVALTDHQGSYRVTVIDGAATANEVLLVVGSAAKTDLCTGGLLLFQTRNEEIATYVSFYDTLNCYYRQAPPWFMP